MSTTFSINWTVGGSRSRRHGSPKTFSGDDAVKHLLLSTALFALTTAGPFVATMAIAGGEAVNPGPVFVPQHVFVPPIAVTPTLALLPQVAAPQATAQIVSQLNTATEFCSAIGSAAYVVDCLSERLAVIEQALPQTGEYAEAREAIGQASRGLRLLVEDNPSAVLPD